MKRAIRNLFLTVMVLTLSAMGFSHFQMIYVTDDFVGEGESSNLEISLIFTHPGGSTHDTIADPLSMNMGNPVKFGVTNKGEYSELTSQLQKFIFTHGERKADAYRTNYRLRGMGDFVFTLEPEPYWEASEEKYITQYSKVIVNRAGLPTDWDAEIGMKAEIVPLTWPMNLYVGSTFRGIVMLDGKPVPNAEIEVEYLNVKPFKDAFAGEKEIDFSDGESPAMMIKANKDGEFSFSYPWAGWWGFAALMEGEPYKGKDQEVGAAMMMKVHEL